MFTTIINTIKEFFSYLSADHDKLREQAYLEGASDRYDLEFRHRNIQRGCLKRKY